MPAPIAAAAGAAAPATSTAPVQTSAGAASTPPAPASKADAPKADPNMGGKPGEKPATEAPKPAEVKRFKTKIKDQGKDVDIDLDEGAVAREIQKSRHYERTRGEFEQQRADFNKQLEQLTSDPLGFLKQRGVDLRELAAQQQAQEAELAKLTPEARALAEAQAEIERLKGAEQKRLEAQQKEAEQAEHNALVQSNLKTLGEAIRLSGRPKSGELLKLFAEVQELAVTNGEPGVGPGEPAGVHHAERLESKRIGGLIKRAATDPAWRAKNAALMGEIAEAVFGALDGKELLDFVGLKRAKSITTSLRALLHKSPIPVVAQSSGETKPPAAPSPQKFDEPQSMWGALDKLAGR